MAKRDFVPATLTIQGDAKLVRFLDHCLQGMCPGVTVRSRFAGLQWFFRVFRSPGRIAIVPRTPLRREFVTDADGNYTVELDHPAYEHYARGILSQLDFNIVRESFPAKWNRPVLGPITVLYDVTFEGISKHFDLSTR